MGGEKPVQKTDKEIVREQTRVIDISVRHVEREITKLDALEKKQLKEVEKLAKAGQHQAAKTVAKTVAMSRKQKNNYYTMTAQLKGISMQLSSMGT